MELHERGLTANRAAIEFGLRSSKLRDILSGRVSITADTALRLSRYLGQEAAFWRDDITKAIMPKHLTRISKESR
jgi:addiction module HigA family antidote